MKRRRGVFTIRIGNGNALCYDRGMAEGKDNYLDGYRSQLLNLPQPPSLGSRLMGCLKSLLRIPSKGPEGSVTKGNYPADYFKGLGIE